MIRTGRKVLDRIEVGQAHGLSAATAVRQRPWAQPGHPSPVNRPAGRVGGLWDAEQVRAYAAGEPIPPLPEHDDPDDLLDADECAALAQIDRKTWLRYFERDPQLVPDADATIGNQPHWRRATHAQWLANRPGRGAGGGRPTRSGRPVHELQDRADEVIAAAAAEGRKVTMRELAAAVGVSPTTAGKLIAASTAGAPTSS